MLPLFVLTMGTASVLPTVSDPVGHAALRVVPLVANADLSSAAWLTNGSGIGINVIIVALWMLIFGVLARRTFRWERRR